MRKYKKENPVYTPKQIRASLSPHPWSVQKKPQCSYLCMHKEKYPYT